MKYSLCPIQTCASLTILTAVKENGANMPKLLCCVYVTGSCCVWEVDAVAAEMGVRSLYITCFSFFLFRCTSIL